MLQHSIFIETPDQVVSTVTDHESGESRDVYIMRSLESSMNRGAHLGVLYMIYLLMHQDTLGHILHMLHTIICFSHLIYTHAYLCM